MPYTATRTILFGDCDPAGVIYTPRVAYFVIEAVHEFLSHLLGGPAVRQLFALGILPPARSLSIEYLSAMVWDDVIEIEVTADEPGTTSFSFSLVAYNATSRAATFRATLTQVCVSPEDKRPTPIPEVLERALQRGGDHAGATKHVT